MRLLQRAVCLAVACFCCAVSVHAEPTYKTTELTFPAGVAMTQSERLQSLSVHGSKLDIFIEKKTQTPMDTFATRRFHSDDGGMTWKEMDMSWLSKIQGDSRWQVKTGVRKDGSVYALLGKDGQVELPAISYNYFIGTLVAHKDGVTRTVCTLDDKDVCPYLSVDESLSQDGDIALFAMGQDVKEYIGREIPNRLITLDPATGKEKTNAVYGVPPQLTLPKAYQNGKFFQISKGQVNVIDVSGKVIQSIPRPVDADVPAFSGNWASAGGAFYELNSQGVYRFRPGETSWTKLLDKSVCKVGTAGSEVSDCAALRVDEDGGITVLLQHYTVDQRYGMHTKAWTLTRYTPR